METISRQIIREAEKWKPLTLAEERELIGKERDNEEHLRNLLFHHNMRAAVNIAKTYGKDRGFSGDDAVQLALLGLYKASRKYDLNAKTRFITFAAWQMIHNVKYHRALAAYKLDVNSISLEMPVRSNKSDNDDLSLLGVVQKFAARDYQILETVSPAAKAEEEFGIKTLLGKALEALGGITDRDKEIIRKYVFNPDFTVGYNIGGDRMTAIGIEYGLTRQRVSQIFKPVWKRMLNYVFSHYPDEEEVKLLRQWQESHSADLESEETEEGKSEEEAGDKFVPKEEATTKPPKDKEAIKARIRHLIELKEKMFPELSESSLPHNVAFKPIAETEEERQAQYDNLPKHSAVRILDYTRITNRRSGYEKQYKDVIVRFYPDRTNERLKAMFAMERATDPYFKLQHDSVQSFYEKKEVASVRLRYVQEQKTLQDAENDDLEDCSDEMPLESLAYTEDVGIPDED